MGACSTLQVAREVGYLQDPNFVTLKIDDAGSHTWIDAELLQPEIVHCPECGIGARKNGYLTQKFVDVPYNGRPTKLSVEIPRRICENDDCGKKTFQYRPGEFLDGRITSRCRRYIEDNCFKMTFLALSKQTSVPEATIRRIAKNLLAKLDANFRIDTPRVLSIDEIKLPSGKDQQVKARNSALFPDRKTKVFRTIISDGETSQVVDVLRDKEPETVYQFLIRLQGFKSIQFVTMDMSANFRLAAKVAFGDGVKIVADRWHVTKRVHEVITKARREIQGEHRRHATKLLRCLIADGDALRFKNPRKYAELMDLLELSRPLREIYWAKEDLLKIYNLPTRDEAEAAYDHWRGNLSKYQEDAYCKLMTTFEDWRDEIFSYWEALSLDNEFDPAQDIEPDHPVAEFLKAIPDRPRKRFSNARAEARNKQLRQLNQAGRSYSFDFFRARAIFSTLDVAYWFAVCRGCQRPMRREMNSLSWHLEAAWEKFASRTGAKLTYACDTCQPISFFTTRSDEKPGQRFARHCGLADIWTDEEPAIKDDQVLLAAAERRKRKTKLFPREQVSDSKEQWSLSLDCEKDLSLSNS